MSQTKPDATDKQFPVSVMCAMWDQWVATIGMYSTIQDQVENLIQSMLDQGRLNREQSQKMLFELIRQTRVNQLEIERIVREGFEATMGAFQLPKQSQLDELHQKIDQLKVNR